MQGGRTCLRDFISIQANGNFYGCLWHHTDITGRKKAEDALRALSVAGSPRQGPVPVSQKIEL